MAVAAIAATACGSDSKSDSAGDDGKTPSTSSSSAVLGPKKAAAGTPVKVGYVYDGKSDTNDVTEELTSAQAVVKYANEHLGGIGGHPIELDACETRSTPAGATNCVTKMVTAAPAAVIVGVTSQPGPLFGPLSAANLPVFSIGALDPKALSASGVYLIGNPLLTVLAGPAAVASDAKIERAAIAVVDNPAAAGQLKAAAPLFYGNVKVAVDLVTIPPDTPDASAQLTAELSKNPGLIQVIGDAAFCGKVMRALDGAGYKGKIVVIPNCLQAGEESDLPGIDGAILLGTTTTDAKSKEHQLFKAIIDTYAGKDLQDTPSVTGGYQSVLGLVRVLAGLQGDPTAASIKSTIEAAPPIPFPLADGMTFQCNKKAVVIAPNICSNQALQTTLDAKGKGTTYTVLDGTKVLTLGGPK